MFIVCHFPHTKSPAAPSQTAPRRYRLCHLVLALLQAGPCMAQQLKAHMVSGVAPGKAYCSLPVCRPEAGVAARRHTSEWSGHCCAQSEGRRCSWPLGCPGLPRLVGDQEAIGNCKCQCPATSRKSTLPIPFSQSLQGRWGILSWPGGRKHSCGESRTPKSQSGVLTVESSNLAFLFLVFCSLLHF